MLKNVSLRELRKRRTKFVLFMTLILLGLQFIPTLVGENSEPISTEVLSQNSENAELAIDVLEQLQVKGRAPKTGYTRSQFTDGWAQMGNCDLRNLILQRDLTSKTISSDDCIVLSGSLEDPYTGLKISFIRGSETSDDVQIDHVVALSDAWQKGAQLLDETTRLKFANDPLNLLAVDGLANQQKGDSDAASWLPPNKSYRCRYVARQIAVKLKYALWITEAEKATMKRILNGCSSQPLPLVSGAS